MQEVCSVQEASRMVLIEHISQAVAVTSTAVHHLFVLTAAANVWVATLSLAAKNMAKRKQSFDKRIVVCGMLVALSVILLYIGSMFQTLDLSMSAIVSLMVVVIVIEMGYKYAWMTYAATAVLAFVLPLPQKSPAIFYACFMGFYPIIKSHVERFNSMVVRWTIKLLIGNIALVAMFWLVSLFLPDEFEGGWILVATYILGVIAFVMYDVALTKLISFYFARVRDKIKIYKYLK